MPKITSFTPIVAAIAIFLTPMFLGCSTEEPAEQPAPGSNAAGSSVVNPLLGEEALQGEALFNTNCSVCHGLQATGTKLGPPLVHLYYEPGHHGDGAFYRAAQNGVPSHHWRFGDMPPVYSVSTEDVGKIICYVRTLQKSAGITDDTWC